MVGSEYCYLHNPDVDQETKREAQARGGRGNAHRNVLAEAPPQINLSSVADVVTFLSRTINELRAGLIDTRVANGIGYLSGHLVKAMEVSELEKRVEALEQATKKN
jgi:hypothetical protein